MCSLGSSLSGESRSISPMAPRRAAVTVVWETRSPLVPSSHILSLWCRLTTSSTTRPRPTRGQKPTATLTPTLVKCCFYYYYYIWFPLSSLFSVNPWLSSSLKPVLTILYRSFYLKPESKYSLYGPQWDSNP